MSLLPTYRCPHCGANIGPAILLKYPIPCRACKESVQIKLAHATAVGATAMFTTMLFARINIALAIVSIAIVSLIGIRFIKLEKTPEQKP